MVPRICASRVRWCRILSGVSHGQMTDKSPGPMIGIGFAKRAPRRRDQHVPLDCGAPRPARPGTPWRAPSPADGTSTERGPASNPDAVAGTASTCAGPRPPSRPCHRHDTNHSPDRAAPRPRSLPDPPTSLPPDLDTEPHQPIRLAPGQDQDQPTGSAPADDDQTTGSADDRCLAFDQPSPAGKG